MIKNCLSLLLLFAFNFMLSQNASRLKVINSYDLDYLKVLEKKFTNVYQSDLNRAKFLADSLGLPQEIIDKNGYIDQLVGLIDSKGLKYYSVNNNSTAAVTTRTNYLNNTYGLFGSGLLVGVWDGGPMRTSHVEFGNRASIGDGTFALNSNSFHATHVAGTIGAAGNNPSAKGMAPQLTIKGFDWFNDTSEVISQARLGMLVSNHSYGVPVGNSPAWYMGAYSSDSRDWDEIAYNLPYYLMVASAGNDGQSSNPSPLAFGFDKLTGNKTSKNNLVIANSQQASIDANGNLVGVLINSGSSQGPTDDRRIKPDITGQGSGLLSTGDASNTSYITLSGTSMSAPNVSGSLILLQEYFERENDRYMKAATLKSLVCHTADDAGNSGPDAIFGWGLLNSKKAAETILYNGLSSSIIEDNLNQAQTITYKFKSNGTPFKGTICWTDPAGNANSVLNSTIPALVNDLDIRITQGNQTFYPWRLQSNPALNALRDGDNNVDNVESVLIDSPTSGLEYTITISHKGNLTNNFQNFSLIVSGIDSSFSLLPLNSVVETCPSNDAVYSLDFKNTNFSAVMLQATNLPVGATVSFSEQSVVVEAVVLMTVSNLENVPNGEYYLNVLATKGSEVKTINLTLKVYNTDFDNLTLIFPDNNANNISPNSEFSWSENENATSYRFQVSQNSDFQNFVFNNVIETTSFLVTGLVPNTSYYWRVLPINLCGEANVSNQINYFKTGNSVCGFNYDSTDFSNGVISSTSVSEAVVPVNVDESFLISNIVVSLNVTHSSVQELKVYLEGPASIGSPLVLLIDQSCGNFSNINASINDGAGTLSCSTTSPAISGTFRPVEQLSYLNNKNALGEWKLKVRDGLINNGGQINSFSLAFCKSEPSLGLNENKLGNISLYPNPAKNILNVSLTDFIDNTVLSIVDLQGRIVSTHNVVEKTSSMDIVNLQSGVYVLRVDSSNGSYSKKFIKQ